ncbi:MAG: c-type cytochrome [Myxococcaceae bacterium]|nr:c-type cytochrome [Myxococcaceae bacterium]
MRTVTVYVTVALVSWGCGSTVKPVDGGVPLNDKVAAGQQAVKTRGCAQCHAGANEVLSGNRGASNLTPDATGLSEWTEADISNALRSGVSREGETLCERMPRYTDMPDAEASAIAAFLKSLAPVKNTVEPDAMCKPSDNNRIAHGAFLVKQLGCGNCHSADLGGQTKPLPDTQVYASNLTPDMATGLGSWTPEQIIGAVRDGIDDEGEMLCDRMPRFELTDDGAKGLAAFLKSLPPIAREIPESTCGNDSNNAAQVAAGKQLATDLNCTRCHGADLSGNAMGLRNKPIYPSNLTPDKGTGLGEWTDEQIITAIRTGVDDEAEMLCSTMPRFTSLTDDNVKAIVAFLKSVPAVSKEIPASTCEAVDDGGMVTPPFDAGMTEDAGTVDAGVFDAGVFDAGVVDGGTVTPPLDGGFSMCTGDNVVISQIYGAGGNTGAVFSADYVELHNRSMQAVDVSGWALQYASSGGSGWSNNVGQLSVMVIQPGAYVLVAVGGHGANGGPLPMGAVTLSRSIDIASSSGKIALTRDATPLTGTCPQNTAIVDFVGYGSANCSMGSAPAPQLSTKLAAVRMGSGANTACVQTQVNGNDFEAQLPQPHMGAPNICLCP